MTFTEMKTYLESRGFVVGNRDARLNTDYAGKFMVAEPYEDSELPTKDASNGPWCVVGDDLDGLIQDAYESYAGE